MLKQPALPGLRDAIKKKVTRREQFLMEVETVGFAKSHAQFFALHTLGNLSLIRWKDRWNEDDSVPEMGK